MKENSIKETIKIIERKIKETEHYSDITGLYLTLDEELRNALMNILSDYKKVLKENETYKKQYFCLIDKIENKIDKFDYEFEKAKRKNDNDRADYYWDLIGNFTKLLESEE